MKKFTYIILFLCLPIFFAQSISAQTCDAWTIDVTTQESTCQANGSVLVTLGGETSNLSEIQYSLHSTTSSFSVAPQSNPLIGNLPPDTYAVNVRAFCLTDGKAEVTRKIENVVVAGNYKVPTIFFRENLSSPSVKDCSIGIIVLEVRDGGPDLTFEIVSAPAGVALGLVVPTKNGANYTLPSNYPSGNYKIELSDGCYTAACTFELGETSGFASVDVTFNPSANSCSEIYWTLRRRHYHPDIKENMFEVGFARADDEPSEWFAFEKLSTMPNKLFDLSPESVFDVAGVSGYFKVHIRLKDCPSIKNIEKVTVPSLTYGLRGSYDLKCSDYNYRISEQFGDAAKFLCYPLTMEIKNTDTGVSVWTESVLAYPFGVHNISLDYGVNYEANIVDSRGKEIWTDIMKKEVEGEISISTGYDNLCTNEYRMQCYNTLKCYPSTLTITSVSTGQTIYTYVYNGDSSVSESKLLEYSEKYIVKVVDDEGNTLFEQEVSRAKPAINYPTSYTMRVVPPASTVGACEDKPDIGTTFIIEGNKGITPMGATCTITGPPGFTPMVIVMTESASRTFTSPGFTCSPGTYTATIYHGCGDEVEKTIFYESVGMFRAPDFGYKITKSCSETLLTPSGLVTMQGVNQSKSTFYRIVEGPEGYDRRIMTPGESVPLTHAGTYVLAIANRYMIWICTLGEITIEYEPLPLSLDANQNSSYVCVDAEVGIMSMKAINGTAPFKYELWNAENTTRIKTYNPNEYPTEDPDRAIFEYGDKGKSYTIRVEDACGSRFSQAFYLIDLNTARIVSAASTAVCGGDDIELFCTTLGETTYSWTGPNGFTSTEQNPVIPNATAAMSGTYTVSVAPEFCGSPVVSSITITIGTTLVGESVSPNQQVCINATPGVLSCTTSGGKGTITHQWQLSVDGTTNWLSIPNATNATYSPAAQSKAGTIYYRRISTDDCGALESDVISIQAKSCYIPVNPHIKSKAQQ